LNGTPILRELKRRSVIRTCIFYILICWGALQVGDIIYPAIGWDPDNASRNFLYLAIAGFPVAFVLAWFFQVTSEGIVRTEPFVDRRVLDNIPSINDSRRDGWLSQYQKQQKKVEYSWILSAESGPLAGFSFGIKDPLVLGRSLDCELTLISPHISRHHARIEPDGDQLAIEDLGSSNGTMVNGKLIDGRQLLHHEDEVSFHDIVFRVTESYSNRHREQQVMNQTTFIHSSTMEQNPDDQ